MVKRISSLILGLALLVGLNAPASAQNFSSVQVLNGSCSAPSFTFNNDPDSGFYLVSAGTIAICINGAEVGRITSNGLQSTGGSRVTFSQSVGAIDASTASYADAASEQAISGDLNVAAGAGTSTAGASAYLAGVMGNVLGANLTDTNNIVAGLVGKYDVTGTNASNYPSGGVVGEIGNNTTTADGSVIAAMGGDLNTSSARAAYTTAYMNSTAASAWTWGLDLQGPGAFASYLEPRFSQGFLRLGGRTFDSDNATIFTAANVCIAVVNSVPVDGVSGTRAGQCGLGSLLIRMDNGTLSQNTGTLASPTWTAR